MTVLFLYPQLFRYVEISYFTAFSLWITCPCLKQTFTGVRSLSTNARIVDSRRSSGADWCLCDCCTRLTLRHHSMAVRLLCGWRTVYDIFSSLIFTWSRGWEERPWRRQTIAFFAPTRWLIEVFQVAFSAMWFMIRLSCVVICSNKVLIIWEAIVSLTPFGSFVWSQIANKFVIFPQINCHINSLFLSRMTSPFVTFPAYHVDLATS